MTLLGSLTGTECSPEVGATSVPTSVSSNAGRIRASHLSASAAAVAPVTSSGHTSLALTAHSCDIG